MHLFKDRIFIKKCLHCKALSFNLQVRNQLFIMRHGETDWNREKRWQGHLDICLNDNGRQQALLVAAKLNSKNIKFIISSDLMRCKETAQIIAKELKTNLIFDSNLRERNIGIVQGLTLLESEQKFGKDIVEYWRNNYKAKLPRGESLEELEDRILRRFHYYKSEYAYKNTLIITHGGPMRFIQKYIRNLPFEDMSQCRFKNGEIIKLKISECCKKCGNEIIL